MTDEEKAELKEQNTLFSTQLIACNERCKDLEKENKELKEQTENYNLSENESKEIIAELKGRISILLSCKSCPENKGGYICEKEYNDKCLAQKIQEIKEQKEEIADLQKYIETLSENYENEIAEHKEVIEKMKCCENCKHSYTDSENVVFCHLSISQENCKSCKLYKHEETNKDYWELAE